MATDPVCIVYLRRYEGAFSRGKRDGQGKYFYANGDSYEGQFKVRQTHTRSKALTFAYMRTHIVPITRTQHLQIQADKKSGQGTERYSTGHVYIGHFKDGRRHGQGSFFYKDGGRCVGLKTAMMSLGFQGGLGRGAFFFFTHLTHRDTPTHPLPLLHMHLQLRGGARL